MSTNPLAPLAADSRSLDGLRSQAARDPAGALRKAAGQFEALFMRQVLKSMREAMPKSELWNGSAESTYTDMLDQQLAQTLSGRPGGLAEVIARQLSRSVRNGLAAEAVDTTASGSAAAAAAGAAGTAGGTGRRSAAGMNAVAGAGGASAATAAAARRAAAQPGSARTFAAVERQAATTRATMPDLSRLSETQAGFVREMWPHALLAQQSTGVPAEWIVGQAALESGWGRRQIRNEDGSTSHNLFGIKAGRSWEGDVARATTTEYVDGQPRRQVERFRAYGSYSEAFTDWARLMTSSGRYGNVLRSASSVQAFSSGMQKAGYATDPQYGAKLERTINQALMIRRLVI